MAKDELKVVLYVTLAALGSSALTGLILVVGLAGRTDDVERSVRRGIEGGVEQALAPDRVQERSAAAGRGLVDGVVGGTFDRFAPRVDLDRVVETGGRAAQTGVDAAVTALDVLAGPPRDVAPVQSRTTPEQALAREAGEVARDAVDLGFDVLDAALGRPAPGPVDDR